MTCEETEIKIIKQMKELCEEVQAFSLFATKEEATKWHNAIADSFTIYNAIRNEEGIELCARLAKQGKINEALNLFNLIIGEN